MSMSNELSQTMDGSTESTSTYTPDSNTTNTTNPFLDSLPEDLRTEPCLSSFKDLGDMAKSYVNAQKMIGGSIRMPSADASLEERQAFYEKLRGRPDIAILPDPQDEAGINEFWNRLGRPEDPDKYVLQIPDNLPIPIDNNIVNEFKGLAHSLGLNNVQADALVQYRIQEDLNRYKAFNESKASTFNLLKERWGQNFDSKLKAAKELVSKYGDQYKAQVEELFHSPAGNNPIVLMMAAELAATYKENPSIDGTGVRSMDVTPEQARTILSNMRRDRNDPLHISGHKDHQARVEYQYQLECIAGLNDR